jgi:hypothetical protein
MPRYLNVPYEERQEAKRLGAQFDFDVKRWWIPETRDTEQFKRWLDKPSSTKLGNLQSHREFERKEDVSLKDPNSPTYLRFRQWWEWWHNNMPEISYKDHVGSFTRIGAVVAVRDEE